MKIVGNRRHLYAGLAAALLLTSSLTAVSLVVSRAALSDEASEQASVVAFFDKGYGVCDADVLSRFWGVPFWDAKVMGGEKVQAGLLRELSDVLSAAYGSHVCDETSSLGYDDAPPLAALWTGTAPA